MNIWLYFVTPSNESSHSQTKATFHLHSVVCGKRYFHFVTKLSVYYPRIYELFRTFNTKQTKADCTFKWKLSLSNKSPPFICIVLFVENLSFESVAILCIGFVCKTEQQDKVNCWFYRNYAYFQWLTFHFIVFNW